jgi:hypothetical protein
MKTMRFESLRRAWTAFREGRDIQIGPASLVWTPRLERLKTTAMRLQVGGDPLQRSQRRSVVFLHNAYYNFYYLSRALRARGWDAVSVSLENPEGPNTQYYHGEDLNLYHPDADVMLERIGAFYGEVKNRFNMVHFHGIGQMSFFPSSFDYGNDFIAIPEDFLELKRLGIKIGYSQGGCNQGISQSSFLRWSEGSCNHCRWQNVSDVCGDRRNLAWGHKVHQMVDLFATEGNPALDYQGTPKCYREPLTTALDAEVWKPDLEIPDHLRLPREPGELIVGHSVGNYKLRSKNDRSIKGTGAVFDAIERLRSEGIKVRLEFRTDVKSSEMRFIQAQCDVLVDQLNYGRYGATAREGMMLGKPTICHLNRNEPEGVAPSEAIEECPLVSANERTVYPVLRKLLLDAAARAEIGSKSRDYALKWHSAEACAERFETVYDRLMQNEPVVD